MEGHFSVCLSWLWSWLIRLVMLPYRVMEGMAYGGVYGVWMTIFVINLGCQEVLVNQIIMDSGASVTITPDKSVFGGTLTACKQTAVVANGARARFGGVGKAFGFPRVYQLESATNTLISMADLVAENDFEPVNGSKSIRFRSRVDGSITWEFDLQGGLWVLREADAAVYSALSASPMSGARAILLHRRLGHPSWEQLRAMVEHQLVDGLSGISVADLPRKPPYCRACALGKIKRMPFLSCNPHRSRVPGAGWNCDVIVLRVEAIQGGRFFLLFTDDCTRNWCGYLLRHKSDAVDALRKFHTDVICFYGLPMVFLRSDRGGEFTSFEFSELLTLLGIRQFLVSPRDPEANGAAERQGQTLFGCVRCVLIDSGLSMVFWASAAFFIIYCRNRLSRRIGKDGGSRNITPFEWLTGKKPSVKHVHVFGAHCTYYEVQGNKLLPRGHAARFIGIADNTYYILYDAIRGKIVTRRHVQFRERGPSSTHGMDGGRGGRIWWKLIRRRTRLGCLRWMRLTWWYTTFTITYPPSTFRLIPPLLVPGPSVTWTRWISIWSIYLRANHFSGWNWIAHGRPRRIWTLEPGVVT